MPPPMFRTFLRTLTLIAVLVGCGGSFVVGYQAGYSEAWLEAVGRDKFTFQAVQEYLKNKPGR